MGTMEDSTHLSIVTEFMEGGSLKQALEHNGPFRWSLTLKIAIDIAQVINSPKYISPKSP
jgi:serine/threonine protein kinase